ncbi:MAG: hypothetical protein IPI21_15545 [Propionivibrio sp.]|nr:hypothetical protein [Propionivibrio sp.]
MQFLEQPIDFVPLAGHAALTFVARVNAQQLTAFCGAAHRRAPHGGALGQR